MQTLNDTTQSNTKDVMNVHEDSLYTALNSQEEITSAFIFPTVATSRQAHTMNAMKKPLDSKRGGKSEMYKSSTHGEGDTTLLPQASNHQKHSSMTHTKKTVYVVKPIMVPVAAIEPRKLNKSQRQWCKYNNMIMAYPEHAKHKGNLVPKSLGEFSTL